MTPEVTDRNQSNDSRTQRTTYEFTAEDLHDALAVLEDSNYEPGRTPTGNRIHAVDFETDSLLARGAGDPDARLCGGTGDYEPAEDADTDPTGWCRTCLRRVIDGDHGLRQIGRAGA